MNQAELYLCQNGINFPLRLATTRGIPESQYMTYKIHDSQDNVIALFDKAGDATAFIEDAKNAIKKLSNNHPNKGVQLLINVDEIVSEGNNFTFKGVTVESNMDNNITMMLLGILQQLVPEKK